MKSLGQIAYEAYCEKTGWKSLATGADLPRWDKLKLEIQEAWEAAAGAVFQAIRPVEIKASRMLSPAERAMLIERIKQECLGRKPEPLVIDGYMDDVKPYPGSPSEIDMN